MTKMTIISFIDSENNEYLVDSNKIEWKEKIKTRTRIIDSYVINNEIIVVSNWKVKFLCSQCGKETLITYSNYKNKKNDICLNCERKNRLIGKVLSEETREKISIATKNTMSEFSLEKKNEINEKRVQNTNWEKRNSKWLKTMQSKSIEEKNEINKKRSESLKNKWNISAKSWLSKNVVDSKYSTIDCKYFTRGIHSSNEIITITCDKCKKTFELTRGSAARKEREHPGFIQCFECSCSGKSIKEKELVIWLKSIVKTKIIENSRKIISPKELDIYIPDYNLAIEFDGLFWHSEQNGADKNYHLNKTIECEKKGIRLIHIFEDEWIYKQEIVKARLKNILGFYSKTIGARKTIIKEIDAKTKNEFLEKYHIQGSDKSNIKLGAFYQDQLIGVMTFALNRNFNKRKKIEGEWELSRFSTISDIKAPGLASKLLTFFERNYNPIKIYSYADRRWSQGNLYNKLNFKLESITLPNYWYAKNSSSVKEHRYNYRKNKLKNFNNYSDKKTEFEIMDELGYLRLWDCGNYKFIK